MTQQDKVSTWMKALGWVEHDNFWALRSDPWAKTTMSKKAAVLMHAAQEKAVLEAELRGRINECHYARKYLHFDANQPSHVEYHSKRLYELGNLIALKAQLTKLEKEQR